MRDKYRTTSTRVLLFVVALLATTLACARADVPAQVAIGSGSLPSPTMTLTTPVPETFSTPVNSTPGPSSTPAEPEPVVSPTFPPTPTIQSLEEIETALYEAQPGDVLRAVAVHFGVVPEDVTSTEPLPEARGLIDPGQLLFIPQRLEETGPDEKLVPDSEAIFSPHATDFDVFGFAETYDGYITIYRESIGSRFRFGPEVVAIVARDNSVNPRLLYVLLEMQSGWVTDPTAPTGNAFKYPMGHMVEQSPGLYRQLGWAANELGNGYYGWRAGTLTELVFVDGTKLRLAPDLNAGTVAIQYFLSLNNTRFEWENALQEFKNTYQDFFGDAWSYQHPLYERGLVQPELILPFWRGQVWAFTGGPHGAWERESAWAALDFAPASTETGCAVSEAMVVAAAPGLVVRSEDGVVVLDLDGDGREQSGWALLYLHIAQEGRIKAGEYVEPGDSIGHPSCEGGSATGTHIHIARKYNGEWILADGPMPFELSGWVAVAGTKPYQGALVKGDQTVLACPCASYQTLIQR
ncbi:MAG: peptidoglycan DD-metalloendopeptidase family protein [Anaerolineales bacterium]|nr:peptidoglycan DD-metalloendopeptidase family protein [Anaerolineales bacterium]